MVMIRVMNEKVKHPGRTTPHLLLTRHIITGFILLLGGRLMKQRAANTTGVSKWIQSLGLVSGYNILYLHTPTPIHVVVMSGMFNKQRTRILVTCWPAGVHIPGRVLCFSLPLFPEHVSFYLSGDQTLCVLDIIWLALK
jgi:hypothetical protein